MKLKLCFFILILPFLAMTDDASLSYDLLCEVAGKSEKYFHVDDPNATLIIKVYNPNPEKPVKINQLSFNIPIGQGAEDLSERDIRQPEMDKWGVSKCGRSCFVATPDAEYFEIGKEILKFPFTDININSKKGTVPIYIEENHSDGSTDYATLECPKLPEGFWLRGPYASKPQVELGESTTISWDGSPSASYVFQYTGSKPSNVDCHGSMDIIPEWSQTTFTLTAKYAQHGNQPITTTQQTIVDVSGCEPVLIPDHTAYLPGQKITLNWNAGLAKEGTAFIKYANTTNTVYKIQNKELLSGSTKVKAPIDQNNVQYELDYIKKTNGNPISPFKTPAIAIQMPKMIKKIYSGKIPNCIAMSEDGKKAYVGNMDKSLTVIQLDTQSVRSNIRINMTPDVIKTVPGAKNRILILDIKKQLIKLFDLQKKSSIDWACTQHDDITCIEIKKNKVYLAGSEYFIVADLNHLNHHIGYVKMSSARRGRHPKPYPSPTSLDLSPKGDYAVITHAPTSSKVNYPGISVIDIRNGKKMTEKIIPTKFKGTSPSLSRCIRFFSDSDAAWSSDADRLYHLRPIKGELVGNQGISGGNTQALLFSPDNSLVFHFNSDKENSKMSIFDRISTKMSPQKLSIPEFPGGPNPSKSIAFTPSGEYLFICDPKYKGVAVYKMPSPLQK